MDQFIQILLFGAAAVLAFYTCKLVKQQSVLNQKNAMPWFRIRDYTIEHGERGREIWIRIEVAQNIALNPRGEFFLKREGNEEIIPLIPFESQTAMPGAPGEVWLEQVRIDTELERFNDGERFRVQANLEYMSILKGKFKSCHWLIFEKINNNTIRRKKSDMEYVKTPF